MSAGMVCEGAFGFRLLARGTCRRDCPAAALHIKPGRPYSKRFELAQAGPSDRSRNVSFMVILQIVVLALIQGITEFLPIS